MGLVTETLLDLLRKQINAHRTVVWYDPEGAYLDVARSLMPEQVGAAAIHRYDPQRGFLWLRRELEPLWAGGTQPPQLLIYVPLAQAEAAHALIEFEVAGAVLRPGQQPPEQNTALAALARRALADLLPEARLEGIVSQVEARQLSLPELDTLAERGGYGVLGVLFGTGHAQEIALRFLSDPSLDTELEARQALGSLTSLLSETLGVTLPADQGAAALRAQVARQVLVTDLVEALGDEVPPSLRTFGLAPAPVARQAAAQIAQAWRNRRDLAASYVRWGLGGSGPDRDLCRRRGPVAKGGRGGPPPPGFPAAGGPGRDEAGRVLVGPTARDQDALGGDRQRRPGSGRRGAPGEGTQGQGLVGRGAAGRLCVPPVVCWEQRWALVPA